MNSVKTGAVVTILLGIAAIVLLLCSKHEAPQIRVRYDLSPHLGAK